MSAPRRTFLSSRTGRRRRGRLRRSLDHDRPRCGRRRRRARRGRRRRHRTPRPFRSTPTPPARSTPSRIYEQLALTGQAGRARRTPSRPTGCATSTASAASTSRTASRSSTIRRRQERMRSVSDFDGRPAARRVGDVLPRRRGGPARRRRRRVRRPRGHVHVENVTGETQQVELDDGKGGTVTETVDVVVPMVGSLTTVLPSNFTDVQSDQANIAGDGRGGTKMSFTMTLVPPIGRTTADFGYHAKVTDGVIPDATISALPVNPLESPSFKTAAESYQGGCRDRCRPNGGRDRDRRQPAEAARRRRRPDRWSAQAVRRCGSAERRPQQRRGPRHGAAGRRLVPAVRRRQPAVRRKR